jgi:hypothetical protein
MCGVSEIEVSSSMASRELTTASKTGKSGFERGSPVLCTFPTISTFIAEAPSPE